MSTRPRDPASARVGASKAAAAAGRDLIIGRRRIAHEIGKSERTVTRLVHRGELPATRAKGIPNAPLAVFPVDAEKVR